MTKQDKDLLTWAFRRQPPKLAVEETAKATFITSDGHRIIKLYPGELFRTPTPEGEIVVTG